MNEHKHLIENSPSFEIVSDYMKGNSIPLSRNELIKFTDEYVTIYIKLLREGWQPINARELALNQL